MNVNEDEIVIERLSNEFTDLYGVYREFVARFDNCIIRNEGTMEKESEIHLTISSIV